MSVFTQMAAALTWPVSRIKRRGKEDEIPPQSDGEAGEPQQNDSGTKVDARGADLKSVHEAMRAEISAAYTNASALSGAAPAGGTAPPLQPVAPAPPPETPAIPPPAGEGQKDDILKLFTEDMAGNEDFERLTPFLKDVDVYELADECRSVAAALQRQR